MTKRRDSQLETNDCAFRSPAPQQDPNSDLALSAHGRVFILYRNLLLNSSEEHSDWICPRLMKILAEINPEFTARQGVVAFTLNPALQLALSKAKPLPNGFFDVAANDPGFGKHLMLSFWGYGNDEDEVFQNLNCVFMNILVGHKETLG